MEIVIYKTNLETGYTEDHERVTVEDYSFENVSKHFSSYMWNKLLREGFGEDFYYMSDYNDYTAKYNTFRYEGEGIYNENGRCVMHVEELRYGTTDIVIDNIKYSV